MKKFVTILLSLLLCLSFVACGGTDGDTTNSDVRDEFIGEWVNLYNDQTFTIEKKSDIKINENEIVIQNQTYNIETRNGITHIVWPDNPEYYDYVKVEDASYSEIEITLNNWNEYFEIAPKNIIDKNSFGEIEGLTVYQCLVAKDDTKARLVRNNNYDTIGIEVIADHKMTAFELDENENIILKPEKALSPSGFGHRLDKKGEKHISDIKISELYNEDEEWAVYSIQIMGGSQFMPGEIMWFDNIQVNRITGKIKLYDKTLF